MAGNKAFLVTYDVSNAESEDYDNIDAALKKLGTVISLKQGSVRWLHETSVTAEQVKNAVVAAASRRRMSVWVVLVGSETAFHQPGG